ncbi:MAG: S41 family peptidase [Bdellovibrionales bacterium]|nr:S41 family peptidase [Bdellovibrionales bacterium]
MKRTIFISFFLLPLVLAQEKGKADKNFQKKDSPSILIEEQQDNDQRYQHLKTFSDVLNIIESSYVRKMSTEQLTKGAIKGMIRELDPYSHFLSAEELNTFKEEARGQFKGFGIELAIKNKLLIVISVLENSPAQAAGLKAGHIIIKVNNQKTIGLNRKEINNLLKTKMKGKISLLIKEPNSKKINQLKLRSKIIDVHSVSYQDLGNQFLYIRINTFTKRTFSEMQKIINKYKKKEDHTLRSDLKGLILDLRGNPGGLFEPAIKIADLFIKKGIIVNIKGRMKDHDQTFKASSYNTFSGFPILVLIDSYSASSAEILAGALQENKRAILLGRKSFGKGSVQSLIPMEDGNAVKLTIAHYYTPNGHSIHEQGIQPDIELKVKETTDTEDTDFLQAVSLLKMFQFFSFATSAPSDP